MIINGEKLAGCVSEIHELVGFLNSNYQEVIINSGYRSLEYNESIGGVRNSQHIFGKAIDVTVKNVSPIKVAALVLSKFPKVNGFGIDVYRKYCHLDVRKGKKTYWVYGKDGKVA